MDSLHLDHQNQKKPRELSVHIDETNKELIEKTQLKGKTKQ
jgi:hypothetical protein